MSEAGLAAFVEHGVGETRTIVVAGDAIVEAWIERDDGDGGGGWRADDIREARLTAILVPGVRGIVTAGGVEALLAPLPTALTEGAACRVRVVREALAEAGRARLAKVVATPDPVRAGPDVAGRLRARGLALVPASPDTFEHFGWSELIESAATGVVAFPGGSLTISPTPAMTVIDVDGDLAPVPLARAAADAAAAAIVRFDITGSIGIDFPTVADKAARGAIGERLDALLPSPFERTAVNGFGFVQVVRPRRRASLIELLRGDRVATAALALLRAAERDGFGDAILVATGVVIDWLGARPPLRAELARRRGGSVGLRIDPALAISAGYVTAR